MGGVAGHAGLFTTTTDLAKFARWAITGSLGKDITPDAVAIRRAFGFDIDSAYSRPRGDVFPYGSFGHTGWTGGFLWIDPSSRSF
jgi:CubicO group peptidase (beta-lactamase class C family)